MAKEIDLSIIIPVYNAENYLEKCIDSVLDQSVDNYEIICVNDGSTDNSKRILDKYKKIYKQLKVIHKSNGGVISARIAGYNLAKGKYIGWVDSDDFVEKNMFNKLISIAKENDADMVYCNYNFYPNEVINKQKWFKSYQGHVDWKLILNNTIQWNKIVKKEILDSLDITNLFENIGEGCYGLVFINSNPKKIFSIDECLYNYRVGHSSLSSGFNNVEWYKKVVDRAKNMYDYVKAKKYDVEWVEFYRYRYLYYNLMLMIVSAYNNNRNDFNNSKELLRDEKFFSKANSQYIKESFSLLKRFYLKHIGFRSFYLMKYTTKLLFK